MAVELLRDVRAVIGESPTWVADESAIYWIDVKAPSLHRLGFPDGPDRTWTLPEDVGAFALVNGPGDQISAALVALRHGLVRLDLATGQLEPLTPAPFDPALTRFNEGACDSRGRFWVGTMFDPLPGHGGAPVPASLHSFTLAEGLRPEPDAAELHNGMAWSPNERLYYLSHSRRREIHAFEYDATSGSLGARRPFAAISLSDGIPDGAAVDAEGGYWCALHGASRLRRYRPDGRLDREVMLPVSQPTMCAFTGPGLDYMVVTTASDKLDVRQLANEPHAGSMFCLKADIPGLPRPYIVR